MKALGWWLMLVGSLRLASVWFGFFDIWALRLAVFSSTSRIGLAQKVSELKKDVEIRILTNVRKVNTWSIM
ncbi:hypothetical protein Goari_003884 [Gossypium aridum]|uniref:Uncharacterized protein n=1 Tax=Gossypium aridum TaxID=34290 RepID=A0A7J8Y398_GOSAI|nr:hypothetical protein [Gossypium aridum]